MIFIFLDFYIFMSLPKITIQIVTYNSLNYLPGCLLSIFNQTYKDFQVLIIDNCSQDGTVEFVKKNYPEATVFQNNKNLGFAKANNQGIKLLHSPYVVICNQDIVLEADWLEKIIAAAEKEANEGFGSFCGKLLKMKVKDIEANEMEKTGLIDSCGLQILKNHQVIDLGAGKPEADFTGVKEMFGCSGALVLYRREALQEAMIKDEIHTQGEYFDEDFFMYKEDVDLAWRLQLLGWRSLLITPAVAYHVRSLDQTDNSSLTKIIKHRRHQHALFRYYSYRNHFLVLIKNRLRGNFWKFFLPVLWFELKKAVYMILFEWSSIKAWGETIKLWPKMRRKRKLIMSRKKVTSVYMRKWIR